MLARVSLRHTRLRAPRGARSFFDEITAEIMARARTQRRGRIACVLRLLEPSSLLPADTAPIDEPSFARAFKLVQAHSPADGMWTLASLRSAASHAERALDDALASAAPEAGTISLTKLPLPPPGPDELPEVRPVGVPEVIPALTFENARDALAPLARVAATQTALRQLDALLALADARASAARAPSTPPGATPEAQPSQVGQVGQEGVGVQQPSMPFCASEHALQACLATLAFGAHEARARQWLDIYLSARAASAEGGAIGDGGGGAISLQEAEAVVTALERTAHPAVSALVRALGEAVHADEEEPWLGAWLEDASSSALGVGIAAPRRRGFLAAFRRQPPHLARLRAFLKAVPPPPPAPSVAIAAAGPADSPLPAGLPAVATARAVSGSELQLDAMALARAPPPQLESAASMLVASATAFHTFADERRNKQERKVLNRYYAAALAATLALDITLSYI